MSVASIEYYEHDTACYEYMTFRAKGLGIIVHVETLSKKKKVDDFTEIETGLYSKVLNFFFL
jgi:hypothetical protein